ncbi:MAG: helix-turn-helix transcriptional regulator [Clostridia bacterium]|nr:helix-turn-helix transcriptional regulator [Clostridia bacterium]
MGLSGVAMILLSVTEIAGQCGYSNASKFAACFRRITGFTPGEWRRSKGITFGDDVPQ